MKKSSGRLTMAMAAAMLLGGVGCADDSSQPVTEAQQEIIGGFKATGRALNAVGTVGMRGPSGQYSYFCSATLIAPTLVLTAKHCAMVVGGTFDGMKLVNLTEVFFAIGPDAAAPVRVVEAIAAELSPLHTGGTLGLGSDVAIYHLAEPIQDVAPLALAPNPFTPGDLGRRYMGIGYGAKDLLQDLLGFGEVHRRAGTMTLRALDGSPAKAIWPTFQDLVDAMTERHGEAVVAMLIPHLRELYEAELLQDYEAWVGLGSAQRGAGGSSDAQSCHGDSGGPLVGLGADKGIYGVVSGGYFSRDLSCDHGTFYATLGPRVREMIDAGKGYTDPCAGVTRAGSCTDTVASRCTDKFEGDRRLAQVDCAELGMVCARGTDGVVGCFDDEAVATRTPTLPPRGMPPSIVQMRAQVQTLTQRALAGALTK